MRLLLVAIGVGFFLICGVLVDAHRQRIKQKVAVTITFMNATARLIQTWTEANGKLPNTLEETNDGVPWKDGCGKPLDYRVDDPIKLKFTLSSSCGGSLRILHYQIADANLLHIP
jgi:hypothetical protein